MSTSQSNKTTHSEGLLADDGFASEKCGSCYNPFTQMRPWHRKEFLKTLIALWEEADIRIENFKTQIASYQQKQEEFKTSNNRLQDDISKASIIKDSSEINLSKCQASIQKLKNEK